MRAGILGGEVRLGFGKHELCGMLGDVWLAFERDMGASG